MEPDKTVMIPVRVECHSGYRADEYPTCFYRNRERYEVLEITDRWYQAESTPGWSAAVYFKVDTDRGGPHILKHDLERDEWYLQETQARFK